MNKKRLSLADIDSQSAIDLPDRNLFAVAVGGGGLIGVGIAIDRSLNDVVRIEDNEVCVSVAAVAAASGCRQ